VNRRGAAAALLVMLLAGCTSTPPDPTPTPTASVAPTESPRRSEPAPLPTTAAPAPSDAGASTTAIDTSAWPIYASGRYGLRIGHPPDWRVAPSERLWMLEEDGGDFASTAQDRFMAPEGDVWVTAWTTPHEGGESLSGVLQWALEYCRASSNTDCSTIGDRAVRLCFAQRTCHPGLLVPFAHDVHAFFTGGEHERRMVNVAIWRSPGHPVPGLGTARQVLDAFLTTMDVWQ